MNKRSKGALVAAAAVAVGGLTTGVAVHAASDAPWQAAAIKSPNAVGSVSLVDAAGHPVTSGSIHEPLAAFAVGSGGLPTGAAAQTTASLAVYTPTSVVSAPTQPASTDKAALTVGPDSWTGAPVSAPTPQTATLPTGVTGPAVDLTGSLTLEQYLSGYRNALTDPAYAGVYELRLSTAIAGRAFTSAYDVLDIVVSGDTWHLYGEGGTAQAAATTTTASASVTGTTVSLSATVAPAAAAGTVEFWEAGAKVAIGSPISPSTGVSTASLANVAPGQHTYTARFVPTDVTAYLASQGSAAAVTVAAPGGGTPTVPTAPQVGQPGNPTPVSAALLGRIKASSRSFTITFAATVRTAVDAKVTVYDGKKPIGTFVVVDGKATIKLKKRLKKGKHSIKVVLAASATSKAFAKSYVVKVK